MPTARLLLVDDHRLTLKVHARLLGRLGYQVETALGGQAAVERFEPGAYDCVLVDCRMPEVDGFDVAREVRAREAPTGLRVPIIAVTGERLSETREQCIRSGMDDCLAKPLDAARAMGALKRWLGRDRGDSRPIIDHDYVSRMGLSDELPELLTLFLQRGRAGLDAVRQQAEAVRLDAARVSVHELKGSCGGVGATRSFDAARGLEVSLGAGGDWSAAVAQLDAELDRVESELRTLPTSRSA